MHFVYPFIVGGHWGCFQFGTITNNVTFELLLISCVAMWFFLFLFVFYELNYTTQNECTVL